MATSSTPPMDELGSIWNAKKLRMQRLAAKAIINGASLSTAQFTIGDGNPGTPENGSDTYVNPLVVSTKNVSVYLNTEGYLTQGVDWDFLEGGGITLIAPRTFDTADTYLVFIY